MLRDRVAGELGGACEVDPPKLPLGACAGAEYGCWASFTHDITTRGHPVLTQSPGAHLRGLSSGHTHRVIPLCVLSDPCTVHTTAE